LSVGPGHVGLLDLGDGVPKFSCHYEADLDRSGHSVPDIRPLLWKDGWPQAGDNVLASLVPRVNGVPGERAVADGHRVAVVGKETELAGKDSFFRPPGRGSRSDRSAAIGSRSSQRLMKPSEPGAFVPAPAVHPSSPRRRMRLHSTSS
jgi:hypothetical protein